MKPESTPNQTAEQDLAAIRKGVDDMRHGRVFSLEEARRISLAQLEQHKKSIRVDRRKNSS